MSQFSAFLPNLSLHVELCPEPLMLDALRQSARDFFTESKCWHQMLDPLAVSVDGRDIEVEQPDEARVITVLDCYFDGNPLKAQSAMQLSRRYEDWRNESGTPEFITMESPDFFRLCPHPDVAGNLTPYVVLSNTLDGNEVPDWVYEEFRDPICHGAAAILKVIRNKPWFDPSAVDYCKAEFNKGVGKAMMRQAGGFIGARIRTGFVNR